MLVVCFACTVSAREWLAEEAVHLGAPEARATGHQGLSRHPQLRPVQTGE